MTDRELLPLLVAAESGNDKALHAWLGTAPNEEANTFLERIARRALLFHAYFWIAFVSLAVSLGSVGRVIIVGASFWLIVAVLAGFGLFGGSLYKGFDDVRFRRGRCAILYLAERKQSSAVSLLLIEWQKNPAYARRTWNGKIEAALAELLEEEVRRSHDLEFRTRGYCHVPPSLSYTTRISLENLVTDAVVRPRLPLTFSKRDDIDASRLCLAVAALRYLAFVGCCETRDVLRKIAVQSPPNQLHEPNRVLVYDIAVLYVNQWEPNVTLR